MVLEFPDRIIRSRFFRFLSTIREVGFLALKTEFFGFFGFFGKIVLFFMKIRQITLLWTYAWRLHSILIT